MNPAFLRRMHFVLRNPTPQTRENEAIVKSREARWQWRVRLPKVPHVSSLRCCLSVLPFFQAILASSLFFFFPCSFPDAFEIISSSSSASATSASSSVSPRSSEKKSSLPMARRSLEPLRIRFEFGYLERFDNIKTSSWRRVVRNKARYCLAVLVRPATIW